MVQFTAEQHDYIADSIKVAIAQMELKVGTILGQGEAMQSAIAAIVERHNAELHANSDRVTELVDKANAANEKLEGSTAKIDESERLMTEPMGKLKMFEAHQVSVFDDQRTQIEKLTLDTETAVQCLDGKLDAAVSRTRADVETALVDMNAKLHTFYTCLKYKSCCPRPLPESPKT